MLAEQRGREPELGGFHCSDRAFLCAQHLQFLEGAAYALDLVVAGEHFIAELRRHASLEVRVKS